MIKKTQEELIEQLRGNLKKIDKKEIIKVPLKNVKVIKINNKINDEITQHSIFHNDLEELCRLYNDVQICVNFFQSEEKNERISRLWGKQNLQSYREQCENLKTEIENFAKENQMNLQKKCFVNKEKYTIGEIRQKLKYLEFLPEEEQEEYLLTKDSTHRQKFLMIQRLIYLEKVLENIEQNLGDSKEEEPIIQKFLQLKQDLEFLRIKNMKINNEKLMIITDELNKNYLDRKMNYFNHLQKDEFKKFFVLFDSTKKSDESDDPEQVFQTFTENQDNIEKAAKICNQMSIAQSLIDQFSQSSQDNYQFLREIKKNINLALEEKSG